MLQISSDEKYWTVIFVTIPYDFNPVPVAFEIKELGIMTATLNWRRFLFRTSFYIEPRTGAHSYMRFMPYHFRIKQGPGFPSR
jgi:hypothetical protein